MTAAEKREHASRLAKFRAIVNLREAQQKNAADELAAAQARLAAAKVALADEGVRPDIARLPDDLRALLALAPNLEAFTHDQRVTLSRRGLAEKRETGGRWRRSHYALSSRGYAVHYALKRAAEAVAAPTPGADRE